MDDIKGRCHTVDPVSNQCTAFSLHVNGTDYSCDMTKSILPWKNTSDFFKSPNKNFRTEFLQIFFGW